VARKAVLAAIDEDVIASAYLRRHLHLFSDRVVEDRGNAGRGIAGRDCRTEGLQDRGIAGQTAVTLMQPYLIVTSDFDGQRPREGSRVFACPRDPGSDIPILNSQLGEASPHLIRAALLQRAQDDARPVGAYVKILHPGEAGDHFFGKSDLVLGSFF
jgi:hypothetical protein